MKKRKMYLITKDYPFGTTETAFIEPEYKLLSAAFDVSIIISEWENTNNINIGNNNVLIKLAPTFLEKMFFLIRFLLHRDAWNEIIELVREKRNVFKQLFRVCMYGAFAEAFFLKVRKSINLKKETEAIFYFYWWDYKCLGLTMHKKRYPNIKIIARTHGYDLYDEREVYGRQYFKPQMDKELERLIFVARYGKQYYLNKYKKIDSVKYPVHCLGVSDPQVDLDKGMENTFQIVSCSNVIPLKRIELIIEGLSRIKNISIKWIHIGDGTELLALKQLAAQKLGDNIEYEFLGRLLNTEVIDFYKINNINCFITTTSTEGNPVSVQEALSFGIPIIATSVSDIQYMIDGNGILLSENPSGDEVANAIETIATMDYDDYIKFRKNSYSIYRRDYNAEINHKGMLEDLLLIT